MGQRGAEVLNQGLLDEATIEDETPPQSLHAPIAALFEIGDEP